MIPFTKESGNAPDAPLSTLFDLFRITVSGPDELQVLRACAVLRRSLEPWVKPGNKGRRARRFWARPRPRC